MNAKVFSSYSAGVEEEQLSKRKLILMEMKKNLWVTNQLIENVDDDDMDFDGH